jgi:hypothetical protein
MRLSGSTNATATFISDVYQDLDDYMYYMFQIYQLTQARMYQGLSNTVQALSVDLTLINCAATILFLLVVLYWFINLKEEKLKLSYLYGYVIQIPEKIMSRKNVINKIKEHIEFSL